MQYTDFDEIEIIGTGGYGTIYSAKYKKYSTEEYMPEIVALKRFKSFDQAPELFISEASDFVYLINIKAILNLTSSFSFNSS